MWLYLLYIYYIQTWQDINYMTPTPGELFLYSTESELIESVI